MRHYLDYNATTPLADKVVQWLVKGDFPWGNPSSQNSRGQESKRVLEDVRSFLLEKSHLPQHKIFFHSGATEGINTFFKGRQACRHQVAPLFVFSPTDHPAVKNLREGFTHSESIRVNRDGTPQIDHLKTILDQAEKEQREVLLNWTWVNNETGVIWPLQEIVPLKAQYPKLVVHVDGAQAIGKVRQFFPLPAQLDAYTFSGHKFGAMKGVGYTIIKKDFQLCPLLTGGGQELSMRSGTVNTLAIYTLQLALEEMLERFDFDQVNSSKEWLQAQLQAMFGPQIVFIAKEAPHRNCNTLCFYLTHQKTDALFAVLDYNGFDLSMGSACSSNSTGLSEAMLALGHQPTHGQGPLRLSLSYFSNQASVESLFQKIEPYLKKYLPS